MPAKFHLLRVRQLQHALELLADLLQPLHARLLVLRRSSSRSTTFLRRLACRPGPQTHTPETFADVDDHAHDLVVILLLECLADGGQNDVKPHVIVGAVAALERVRPATAVLVLWILPLGAHALLEEVIVRLLRELGGRSDVVLGVRSGARLASE